MVLDYLDYVKQRSAVSSSQKSFPSGSGATNASQNPALPALSSSPVKKQGIAGTSYLEYVKSRQCPSPPQDLAALITSSSTNNNGADDLPAQYDNFNIRKKIKFWKEPHNQKLFDKYVQRKISRKIPSAYISGIKQYLFFCESLKNGRAPFPVVKENLLGYLALCKSPSTFNVYKAALAHMHKELDMDASVFKAPELKSLHQNLSESHMTRPVVALLPQLVNLILPQVKTEMKMIVAITFCFWLRLKSETLSLRRGLKGDNRHTKLPPNRPTAVFLEKSSPFDSEAGEKLIILYRKRKRCPFSRVIRGCTCSGSPKQPSGFRLWHDCCPVHVFYPWLEKRAVPGAEIFSLSYEKVPSGTEKTSSKCSSPCTVLKSALTVFAKGPLLPLLSPVVVWEIS